jgi:class 3 adenylate cyclase
MFLWHCLALQELSEILNSFFHRMIDIVYKHGGDVIKFCGDALLVVFQYKGRGADIRASDSPKM